MADSGEKVTRDQTKQKIRNRYRNSDKEGLVLIPAQEQQKLFEDTEPKRVCAYCRVSTDDPNQTSSYELQKRHYEEMIQEHENWNLVDIYADEGISGTSLNHRDDFNRMIQDCRAGKIDVIVTKSVSRFARNIVDCIDTVRKLAEMPTKVGVLFEAERIYTLEGTSEMMLAVLSAAAQEESRTKSEIMNISIEQRFSLGLFLTTELLGYDRDEDGNLIVNEDEARTVKLCYNLFVGGYSSQDVADILMGLGRKTKLGNIKWTSSTVLGVLKNEKHYGALLAHKTYTPNYLNHKTKPNRGNRNQWYKEDHHEPIVSKKVWDAAQMLIASHKYMVKGGRQLPTMQVIDTGILKGYIPMDLGWRGFSLDEYMEASKSVYSPDEELTKIITGIKKATPGLQGFQIAKQYMFFPNETNHMTISKGKIRFSKSCTMKLKQTEYVELLFNPMEHMLAIRPCDVTNPNAIHWGREKGGKWYGNSRSCSGLMVLINELLGWNDETTYKIRAMYNEVGGSQVMIFDLDDPFILNKDKGNQIEWEQAFEPMARDTKGVRYLEKLPETAAIDIRRKAKTVPEINGITQEEIEELLMEAENIMERIREEQ